MRLLRPGAAPGPRKDVRLQINPTAASKLAQSRQKIIIGGDPGDPLQGGHANTRINEYAFSLHPSLIRRDYGKRIMMVVFESAHQPFSQCDIPASE
jgi:hypothetical protein